MIFCGAVNAQQTTAAAEDIQERQAPCLALLGRPRWTRGTPASILGGRADIVKVAPPDAHKGLASGQPQQRKRSPEAALVFAEEGRGRGAKGKS